MFVMGSRYQFEFEYFGKGVDLSKEESVTKCVDVAMLPKSIGGSATSPEGDEHCCRGVGHPTIANFVAKLG